MNENEKLQMFVTLALASRESVMFHSVVIIYERT